MTSADDRREHEDAWARAVAEDAAAQEQERGRMSQPQDGGDTHDTHDSRDTRHQAEAQADADDDPFGGGGLGAGEHYFGPELGPLVDEVRRFATAVGDKVQEVSRTLGNGEGLDQLTAPLREKHPEVYRHLAAAGGELLAAYRVAVSGHERRWSAEKPSDSEHIDLD